MRAAQFCSFCNLEEKFPISLFNITSVFNLEISESGSYVSHGILNWIISKTVWVRLWYWDFEQLWTIDFIKLTSPA